MSIWRLTTKNKEQRSIFVYPIKYVHSVQYFRLPTITWFSCALCFWEQRLCVKKLRRRFTLGWMIIFSNNKMINWWSNFHILQTAACRGISSPPLFLSPSRLLSPPSSSVLRLHSSVVWRCIDNTPLFFNSYWARDYIISVLMSRRDRRLTKWSYHTNSVGTNSWFWQQHLCHLH